MILRRKKLLKSLCKKEILSSNPSTKEALAMVSSMIEEREKQKSSLLENFTVGYLEEMLKSTTKSIARDVVKTLIETDNAGVLLAIEKRSKQKPVVTKNTIEDVSHEQVNHTHTQEPVKSKSIIDSYKNSQSTNKIPSKSQTTTNWKSMERSSSLQKAPDTGVKFPPATLTKKAKLNSNNESMVIKPESRSSSSKPSSKVHNKQ